ncbi:hypothetical protein PC128_g14055 [Phytophthora cactorum]|nr:hypothetical protein PC128_g14055 [Phytophthora cactorum]
MSGFIRRTAARALDLTGYLSQSSSPLPDDDSAPPRGDTAVPGRSDAPPVLAAGVQSASEASPAAPVASPIISHTFTTQSALLGVSEEALRDTVDEVATAASDRNLTMTKASGTSSIAPRQSRKSAPPSLLTLSTSGDVGKLRARLDLTYAGRQALEVQLLTHIGLRENAELFARQATAEIEELQTELKRGKDSDAAHLRRFMDAQGSLDASTETTVKLRQFIKSIQESNLSIQKQVQREREVFKAKVVANAKQTSKLHRLLSDLIKGDSSDGQALLSKVAVQRDRINRLTRANGILRQQVDLRAMDAVTLVLAIERIASGDINLDLLDLDQSTRDALDQLQQLDACVADSAVPEAQVNRLQAHQATLKTRSVLIASRAAVADVPGIASDPSPSKRRGLRMPKAWRKAKPAKKRRAASAPAAPSSPSPSPIVPSVAAPASGTSLAVTQVPAQASLSTGDASGARTVSQPAPTDVFIVARRATSLGEGSARRTSSVTGSEAIAGTSVKVGLRLYPSSMFPVPSHAAASSSVPASAHSPASLSGPSPRERATPSLQSSQRSQLKPSLLAEQESASDSDVLGLESEVVEVSSGDEGSRSPAVPSSGDVEAKTEYVTVDSPVQEVPSSQPSGRVLSLTPGSDPVIRLSSEASPAAGPIPVPSQA